MRVMTLGQMAPTTVWWSRPGFVVAGLALLMFGAVLWNEIKLDRG